MSLVRVTKRLSKRDFLNLMDPLIAEWFDSRFEDLTEPQSYAIPLIHERKNVLVSSPTGSGKTLTAFTSIINELFKYSKEGKLEDKIYAVYISPLKALANDINKNLEEPLQQINDLAVKKGMEAPKIRVGVRSGDTSQSERQKQLRKPPHIFITTPESLAMVLAAPKFREKFAGVEYLIIDEIHEVCDSKRGVHLSLTTERLQSLCPRPITRIGLSATLAPIEHIASYLVGYENGQMRDCHLIEIKTKKSLDLRVICPTEDITTLPYEIVNAKMYDMLRDMIEEHKTTLIFTNTRSGTESVVFKLKERGVESIEAHHGSLSKESRLDVEDRLKNGELRCVVSSTSLELGIDIGSVDLVCQIGSPKSVAKGLQRIGRSGHSHGKTPKGRMLVFDLDDLVECAVLCRAAHNRNIDRVTIPENCLDVLAQSIVGMSLEKRWEVEEAYEAIKRSHCYRNLPRQQYMEVLRYLGSRDAFEGVYSKIWYDETEMRFGKKKGARMIYFMNLGTIPEEAHYKVFTEKGSLIGDLSEKFVERLATRDVFVLGGRSYEFVRAKGMKAFVKSASGRKPTVPSWTGEMLPRSFDLSMEIARFRREMAGRLEDEDGKTIEWLVHDFDIDVGSARSILSYFREQKKASLIPDDKVLAIEGYRDMADNSSLIFHFPFGRRVNDALSRAYAFELTQRLGGNVSVSIVDDAFMVTTQRGVDLESVKGMVSSLNLDNVLRRAVKDSELFKQRFRHTAARSFMILRNYKGREVSVNRQQVRSQYLLDYLISAEGVPVIEETFREILEDVMDIQNAKGILEQLERGEMTLSFIHYSGTPSPFAANVVLAGTSDIVLMEDRSSLLKQLHRKVLSKVMGSEAKEFEFEEEQVAAYFRNKIGTVESKAGLLELLRRAGPMHIFREKGKNVYPYSTPSREQIDRWAEELLAEGKIVSVFNEDTMFVASEHLPYYAEVLRRERPFGELEQRILGYLAEERTHKQIESFAQAEPTKLQRALRNLESSFRIERPSYSDGKWTYRARMVDSRSRQEALDLALTTYLELWAPATVEEMAYSFNLNDTETKRAIMDLVEEGIVDEGKFVIAEGTQYMLKKDHLRLRSSNLSSYDNRTVESYRRQKTHGPFRSIVECMRIIGEAGIPLDVFNRVEGFDIRDWQEMRRNGELLLGRFMRGRVRYVLANEGPMYASMFRNSELSGLDNTILRELELSGGMSLRQLTASIGLDKEVLKEAVDRLDRNLYLVRKYEEGEDWARENVYIPYHPDTYTDDAPARLVERYLRAYGPVQPYSIGTALDMMPTEVRERLMKLDVATISVGETRTEMVMLADELPALDRFNRTEEGVKVVSLYDPDVQPMWAEIASRYGEGWIFPILSDGHLIGAIEKWEMSGCTEIRSFDLDEPKLLPDALDAIDRMMRFYQFVGYDVVRIREVLGTPVNDLDEETSQILLSKGYIKLDGMYAKGNMVPLQVSEKDYFAYVFSKQHVGSGRRYPDEIEAVRSMGGLRSDAAAYLRSEVHVPLKKLAEQGSLIKVWAIPEYSTYTSLEHAALYRKVRNVTPSADMANLLRIIEEEAPISKHKLFDLSPVGHRRSYDALRVLLRSTIVYADGHGLLRPIPDNGMGPAEAKKELMRMAFRNFGIFSAESLSRFLGFMPMRELRTMLAELEKDGLLVKGFLLEGADTMHWMLAADVGTIKGVEPPERFVLTSDDNLAVYFQYPWIRTMFGCTCNVIFDGVEMKAAYKARTRGKDIIIVQFTGDREARRTLNDHIRSLGLTLRDEEGDRIKEWEIQEFYEKTHLGEED